MASEVKWIKFATGFPSNRKIKQLRKLPDGDKIALMWVFMLCLAGEVNEQGLIYLTPEVPYTEEMLADEFDLDINVVRLGLEAFQRFGMIEVVNDIICLASWEKWQSADALETIREQTRNRVAKHRAKQKLIASNVTGNVTVTQCNATEEDKERDLEKEKEIKRTDYQFIADLYNEICISFPRLKSLSDSRKKAIKARLNTYSVDDFKSLFEKAEASDFLKGKNDRNWLATFDWLIKDSSMAKVLEGQYANKPKQATGRKEVVPAWMSKPNRFHNYEQRDTDYDSLVDQNDPLMRTAANDEGIRERAEALKRQFAEGGNR